MNIFKFWGARSHISKRNSFALCTFIIINVIMDNDDHNDSYHYHHCNY